MKKRITKPGRNDLEWMLVVMYPTRTSEVLFCETEEEAKRAALNHLEPKATTFVGRITSQGEFR